MGNDHQTKLCKHCKTEIPKAAKVCPNCRKKQGGVLKWIVIVLIALAIIFAISGGSGDDSPKKVENNVANDSQPAVKDSETEEVQQEETIFQVGETAELNGVKVTMTDYLESTGSDYNKPTDGNVFILAEFEIENGTDKEMTVSSMMSFEAYADDYALNYSVSALIEKGGSNQLDGTIAAGKKMKGTIGYEVPADWKNVEIHFTDDVWSNNKFKFEITK